MKVILTGGAGFIGSHVCDHLIRALPDLHLVVLDRMTYAADFRNLANVLLQGHAKLVVGDVCDLTTCTEVTKGADVVVHLAAESHVDNSFGNSLHFTTTNVLGTHTLMEACRINNVPRIVHVSTDEVYGELADGCSCDESAPLNPSNPYSASKAAAEMIIRGYMASFGLPVIILRGNNVYGTRQYPEKIIPKFCMQLIRGKMLTVHGDGGNTRTFLAADDLASALEIVLARGEIGQVYNVGTSEEYANLSIAGMICEAFGVECDRRVEFVEDRPFNDRRYSVNCAKIRALGWAPDRTLTGQIDNIAQWYRDNAHRYAEVAF